MSIVGCLLGTAVGDALGLPYEGLSPTRSERLLGPPDRFRLLFGRGMVSDDTEHACITAQALIASAAEPSRFSSELARLLRWWLIALPPGVGLATIRGISRTAVGIPPDRSGVRSAGNGPVMRAPILGAAVDDVELLRELVHRATVITHRDPRAEWGALAVALGARHARAHREPNARGYLDELERVLPSSATTLMASIRLASEHVSRNGSVLQFAERLGLERGVTGFVDHTVPVALCAWLRHPKDLTLAVVECIRCGGDTDSVAAIVGGIVGSGGGPESVSAGLLGCLYEWPRSVRWMRALGEQVERVIATRHAEPPLSVPYVACLSRNVFLLAVVVAHGLRRFLPPY